MSIKKLVLFLLFILLADFFSCFYEWGLKNDYY